MAEQKIQVATTLFQKTSSDAPDEEAPQLPEMHRYMHTQKYPVIWTPGFMVLFGVVCALGLSLASVLTQGWLNGFYPGGVVLLVYALTILGLWLALFLRTKNLWLRLAALFGCGWIVLTGCNFLFSLFPLSNGAVIAPHIDAAASSALLGASVCLSLGSAHFDRWDRWCFRLALLVLLVTLLVACVFGAFLLIVIEDALAGTALCLSIVLWWLRPSCWRSQPLPTLLFGLIPLIQLLFNLPHNNEANFFFTQVLFLSAILGLLRVLQKERRWEAMQKHPSGVDAEGTYRGGDASSVQQVAEKL